MKVSFRLLLVTGFTLLFLCAWAIPVILISTSGLDSIDQNIKFIVQETISSMRIAILRQFSIVANSGLAIKNWTRINGLPFANEINHRTYFRKTFGQYLASIDSHQPQQYRRFIDGSEQIVRTRGRDSTHYHLCQTDGIWNSSLSLSQHLPKHLFNCTSTLLFRNNGSVVEDPQLENDHARLFTNGPVWNTTVAKFKPPSIYTDSYWYLGPVYLPNAIAKVALPLVQAIWVPQANNILLFSSETFAAAIFQRILFSYLPTDDPNCRAFLVDPNKLVIASSHSAIFFEVTNAMVGDVRLLDNKTCFADGNGIRAACFYNISTHPEYELLRLVNAESRPSQEAVSSRIEGPGGDVYLWASSVMELAVKTPFTLYLFVPRSWVTKNIDAARERIIIIIVVLIVCGAGFTYLLLSPIMTLIEDLCEKMAKDPFDPELLDEDAVTSSLPSSSSASSRTPPASEVNSVKERSGTFGGDERGSSHSYFNLRVFNAFFGQLEELQTLQTGFVEFRKVIDLLRSFMPDRRSGLGTISATTLAMSRTPSVGDHALDSKEGIVDLSRSDDSSGSTTTHEKQQQQTSSPAHGSDAIAHDDDERHDDLSCADPVSASLSKSDAAGQNQTPSKSSVKKKTVHFHGSVSTSASAASSVANNGGESAKRQSPDEDRLRADGPVATGDSTSKSIYSPLAHGIGEVTSSSGRFLVAVVRVKVQSADEVQSPAMGVAENNNENNQSKYQALIDETHFVVDTIYKRVLLPTGATLIEYRNDFFVIALRLTTKQSRSKLACRFVEKLVQVSEMINERSDTTNQRGGAKDATRYNQTPAECVVLTAGISVGEARLLRMKDGGEGREGEEGKPLFAVDGGEFVFNGENADDAMEDSPRRNASKQSAAQKKLQTAQVPSAHHPTLPLRPVTIIGQCVSDAFECERYMGRILHSSPTSESTNPTQRFVPGQHLLLPHAICHRTGETLAALNMMCYFLPRERSDQDDEDRPVLSSQNCLGASSDFRLFSDSDEPVPAPRKRRAKHADEATDLSPHISRRIQQQTDRDVDGGGEVGTEKHVAIKLADDDDDDDCDDGAKTRVGSGVCPIRLCGRSRRRRPNRTRVMPHVRIFSTEQMRNSYSDIAEDELAALEIVHKGF